MVDPVVISQVDAQSFDDYKNRFAKGCFGIPGGFLIQPIGGVWFDPKRKIRDADIIDHLEQRKSIAAIPAYYPINSFLDIDFNSVSVGGHYSQVEDRIMEVIDLFQLQESEYLRFTSPSFTVSGNQHIIIHGTYCGEPASARLTRKILEPIAMRASVEVFPWGARKLRLPFGFGQHLIDKENGAPLTYTWQEKLHWLNQIAPVDLERYPFQGFYTNNTAADGNVSSTKGNGECLWEHGLQANGTRHTATGEVARFLYFRNYDHDTAKEEIKRWLRAKNNDFSKEIKKGNWRVVDIEVDAWVEGTYTFFEKRGVYPTSVHNMQGWLTRADVDLVINKFPGDWVNQKRFCRLLQHYRGRTGGVRKWITIHRNLWRQLGGNDYIKLREALEREVLEINNSYRAGMYSKRILLRVPTASPAQMLQDQTGRAVNEWKKLLLMVFGDVMAAARASGANFQRFYEEVEK